MKRKSRDTTIFSMSALDLFCSAMGVFMVLCIVVFPSYSKTSVSAPPPAPAPAPPAPVQPQKEVVASLTVALEWAVLGSAGKELQGLDMDLHVKDPAGRHYYYKQKKNSGSVAQLVTDSINGGSEVWLHPKVEPGNYKVSFRYFSSRNVNVAGNSIRLKLHVVYGGGSTEEFVRTLPGSTQPHQEKEYPWLDIRVSADGSVNISDISSNRG